MAALLAALGALHGLAFALPGALAMLAGPIQILLFALAWYWLGDRTPRRTGLLALAFGVGHFVTGLAWLYISMHDFGGMHGALAAAAVVLLSLYLALYGALALSGAAWWAQRTASRRPARTACIVAACWGLGEIARGFVLTGFPWLATGYAHIDAPWQGLAPLVGSYGLGVIGVLIAVWLAELLRAPRQAGATGRPWPSAAALLIVIAAASASSLLDWGTPVGAPVSVRLTQGNVPQSMKFDAERSARATADYLTMIADSQAALTVLPETAFVRPLSTQPGDTRSALAAALRANGGQVAIGMPAFSTDAQARRNPRIRLTNSIITLSADGEPVNRFDKRHLVPFGEYIPYGFAWFVNLMNIPLGEFGRGHDDQAPLTVAGRQFAFNICYEDLFGEELAIQVRDGANVLINVSNIAWFGNSHALPQHLSISRMRALELARPMLRATNTGVTASIDHRGNVLAALPVYQQDVLDIAVQPSAGLTPFARLGMLAPLLLIGLLGLVALLPGWRNR